ncbi:hypothetical protein C0J52_19779 [Blattella germanica]|nr:hypothetical protein C0J52_19779 [Blattella germanica]
MSLFNKMSYEENEKRVLTLIDDALNCENNVIEPFNDDADSDEEDGEVEVFDVNTDTEQESEVSDDEQFEIPIKVPSFKSKDGTVWKQHYPPKAVRTRQCNIVTHLPDDTQDNRPVQANVQSSSGNWTCNDQQPSDTPIFQSRCGFEVDLPKIRSVLQRAEVLRNFKMPAEKTKRSVAIMQTR